jgi:histidine triad (HIT) family protein
VIYQSKMATAFLARGRWPRNPVDVLVIPNEHFESLYDLPLRLVLPLHQLTRAMALALKRVYNCEGISTRQPNEQAGDQDVWHYHVHVTPRFVQDEFYQSPKVPFPEPDRIEQAVNYGSMSKPMRRNFSNSKAAQPGAAPDRCAHTGRSRLGTLALAAGEHHRWARRLSNSIYFQQQNFELGVFAI